MEPPCNNQPVWFGKAPVFHRMVQGMGITAFYGASMEDEDAVKLLKAAYDMGYRRGSDPISRNPKSWTWKTCGRSKAKGSVCDFCLKCKIQLLSFSWTTIFKPIRFGRGWWNWHFWTFGGYCGWFHPEILPLVVWVARRDRDLVRVMKVCELHPWYHEAGICLWEMMEHDGTWSKLAAGMSFEVIMGMSNYLLGGLKDFWFSISYMACHPSHWRTHIFQDGYCTTNQVSLIVQLASFSQSFFVGNPSTTDTDFCVDLHVTSFGAGGNMWKHVETSYGTFFCKMVSNPHS